MSNPKNKGTKLFFSQFGGEQPIPPEFIAAMNRAEEIQSVPNDVTPENLSDTIVESKVETNRANERVRRTVKKTAGNIGPLHFIHVNEQGKPVQVSRTLIPTVYAVANPSIPTATSTPADQDLGNGWTIREVSVEGTYIAGTFTEGVFPGNVFERERPNLIPEEFRPAIPTVTTRVESAGTAVDPTLSGTELSERQEQITDLKKRITISTQAAPSLPVTLDKGRDTNQFKQDVTVTRKLVADGTAAETATALKDVQVKQLGDGNKVQETREIANVFDADTRSIEIPDATPPWAKSLIPTTSSSTEAAATSVSSPTLSTGQRSKTVSRTTEKTVKTTIVARDAASLPQTRTNKELTIEFGGSVIDDVQTIASGAQSPSSGGLMVVDSKVEILGDGTSVKSVKTAEDGSWPSLSGTKIDENLRIAIPYTKQVVAAGTAGGVVGSVLTEVQPLDKWRSITIASTIPDDLSELDVTYPTTRNHIFPDTITDAELIEIYVESTVGSSAAFAYDAQVKYKLKSGYRGPCDGQIIETYTNTPDDTSYPVTKFFPEQFLGYTKFFYGFAGDNLVAQARVIVHSLPSSLHDEIDLTPAYADADGLTVPATDPIALPTPGTLITVDRSTERWRFGIWRNQVTQIYVP